MITHTPGHLAAHYIDNIIISYANISLMSPSDTEQKRCECSPGSLEASTLSMDNEINMDIYSLPFDLKWLTTYGICYTSGRLHCTSTKKKC